MHNSINIQLIGLAIYYIMTILWKSSSEKLFAENSSIGLF
jgi:hypothetical protein